MRNQLFERLKASKKQLETRLQRLSAKSKKPNAEVPRKNQKWILKNPCPWLIS